MGAGAGPKRKKFERVEGTAGALVAPRLQEGSGATMIVLKDSYALSSSGQREYFLVREGGWRAVFFSLFDCDCAIKEYPETPLAVGAAMVRVKILKGGRAA